MFIGHVEVLKGFTTIHTLYLLGETMRIPNHVLYSKKFLRGIRSVYKHDKHRLLLTELEYIQLTYDYIKNSDHSECGADYYGNIISVVAGYGTRDIHYGDVFQFTVNVLHPNSRWHRGSIKYHLHRMRYLTLVSGCSQYLHVKHTSPTQRVITLRKVP